ncbi:acyl-CoA dehydrogenase family protein [Paenibacillus amylolyticus]|uniref:acyl-CoA dehydrogenase family protein n=1 Tax=Paenibacillus amylolyticus TaxID=1451 RepID=UPI00201E4595|nr:acyl-CoA dehydrogenase family protein [Paenibacillus amylolyticus]MCL6661641.1 acyl-CoA dehydrogenase [Paenibacillus amylolyticus]
MRYSYEVSEVTDTDTLSQVRMAAKRFAERAGDHDREGSFPKENIADLKSASLMSASIPSPSGGERPSLRSLSSMAELLASGCLSTGMIWAMHIQQVEVLIRQDQNDFSDHLLSRLQKEQPLIASVTTEKGKGGHLLSSQSPMETNGNSLYIDRDAPVVTGGEHADWFLITMKPFDQSPDSDVQLVFAERHQLELESVSDWHAMGMRGTGSVGMHIRGSIREEQMIGAATDFKQLAVQTMIPMGHILWSACWLGAAKGVYEGLIQLIRNPQNRSRFNLQSDLLYARLARVRLQLDTVNIYLNEMIKQYEDHSFQGNMKLLEAPRFNIHINNLKILASETLFQATDQMIDIAGLSYGYTANDRLPLERAFRDLRSASLMYHNDRLLLANGKLNLIDHRLLP